LSNTIAEANKGNSSVLNQDHSLIIDNDDLNDDANGQIHTSANVQKGIQLRGMLLFSILCFLFFILFFFFFFKKKQAFGY
jgi:ATP-dependent Zn protease